MGDNHIIKEVVYDHEGSLDHNGDFTEYRKQTSYSPEYVTASQGKIYINGMLIDECYDIQYSYREFKEPLFGYNSKHFDKVLPGTVVIHGALTINYKHDGYLHAALHEASGWRNNNGHDSLDSSIKLKNRLDSERKDYVSALQKVKDARNEKRSLQEQRIFYVNELEKLKERHKIVSVSSTISTDEIKTINNNIAVINTHIKNLDSSLLQISEFEKTALDNVRSMKTSINDINKAVAKNMELGDRYIEKNWQRAEDHEDFNIYLEYNGNIHKVLINCHLTGHSHVVTHSGQPVKEYYTFIAQKIN